MRRANAHSIPTMSNDFSVNRRRAFFRCSECVRKVSMEYSKNARSLDVNAARAREQLLLQFCLACPVNYIAS